MRIRIIQGNTGYPESPRLCMKRVLLLSLLLLLPLTGCPAARSNGAPDR